MRPLLLAVSALALSSSVVFAQTPPAPPSPGGDIPSADQPGSPPDPAAMDEAIVDGPEGEPAMRERRGGRDRMGRHGGPRHQMRGEAPRGGQGWRAMRRAQGSEFKVEIDEDGSVKVEVRCGPREEARACADITMELLDRAYSD